MNAEDFVSLLESTPQRVSGISYREPLRATAREVGRIVEGNFLREEDRSGVPWAPHSPVTIALHGEHELLRLTYAMYGAATDLEDGASKSQVDDREIVFGVDGTEIPYARYQQSGTRKIPARPYFYVNDNDLPRLAEVFRPLAEAELRRQVFP